MVPTIVSAICQLCHGEKKVPDPHARGRLMACPACDGDDDPTDPVAVALDAPPLPAAPVGRLELWAVSADEGRCSRLPLSMGGPRLEEAKRIAGVYATSSARNPSYGGGSVRVTDDAGNEWHREEIPGYTPAAA